MKRDYIASYPKHPVQFTPEMLDVVNRRVVPFLRNGWHHSLERLMAEAYLQGIRDTLQCTSETAEGIEG